MNPTSSTRLALTLLSLVAAVGCGGRDPSSLDASTALETSSAELKSGGGAVASFALSSHAITAGGTVTGTVQLSGSASGAVYVYLGFRSPYLAGPGFVRIPSGKSSATFTLYANPYLAAPVATSVTTTTSSPQPASFFAESLTIAPSATPPAGPAPQVASLTLAPSTVVTGSFSLGTVTLGAPAPASGAAVQLHNSGDFFNQDADLPAVVVVPAGETSATFPIATHLSSSAITTIDEIIVGNYFGSTYQGAYLTITR